MPKKLEPGEHTDFADVTWKKLDNGSWQFWWTVRLHDGRKVRRPSQGPSKGEARSRARKTVGEMLATGNSGWKTSGKLIDYIERVTKPAIEDARLADHSKRQYRRGVAMLVGDCEKHNHVDSLKGHTIATGTKFRALERCLKEVAQLHGQESAHQARSVLSKYVMQQLVRDELIPGDPLRGTPLNLGAKSERSRGGKALTAAQRRQVIDHLLDLDPAEGISRRQGRWSLEHLVNTRRHAIDLTLLQAVTGVRVSEGNGMRIDRHLVEIDGHLVANITKDLAKNSMERRVPLLLDDDGRVVQRLRGRRDTAPAADAYLIGAPADRTKVWEAGNCNKKVAQLYQELGTKLGIEELGTERTHIWRTTLNSLMEGKVSAERRAALFGHTPEINAEHYTDLQDISQLLTVT